MSLEDQNKMLKAALDQILHGTLIDPLNHNDNGMYDFNGRTVFPENLQTWVKLAENALKVAK